jgi:hypothetical protein
MKQISLWLDEGLLEEIDRCRGAVPRQRYIRSVLGVEVAMRSVEKRPAQQKVVDPVDANVKVTRRAIDTTLEPGQVPLAPKARGDVIKRQAEPNLAAPCHHAWSRAGGVYACKHCGEPYTH